MKFNIESEIKIEEVDDFLKAINKQKLCRGDEITMQIGDSKIKLKIK
jgi:hypothetical protein